MPKFSDEIAWVKRVAHSIATANGHDDPDAYAEKVAEVHAAKDPDAPKPEVAEQPAEGEQKGA